MDSEVPQDEVAQLDTSAHSIDSEIVAMQRSLVNKSNLLDPLSNEEDDKVKVNNNDVKDSFKPSQSEDKTSSSGCNSPNKNTSGEITQTSPSDRQPARKVIVTRSKASQKSGKRDSQCGEKIVSSIAQN